MLHQLQERPSLPSSWHKGSGEEAACEVPGCIEQGMGGLRRIVFPSHNVPVFPVQLRERRVCCLGSASSSGFREVFEAYCLCEAAGFVIEAKRSTSWDASEKCSCAARGLGLCWGWGSVDVLGTGLRWGL